MFNWLKRMFVREKKMLILPRLPLPEATSVSDSQLVRWGLQVPYVAAAVNLIANAIANLPFNYRDDRTKNLLENPNPEQSQMTFFQALAQDLVLYGNAYILLGRVRNRIAALWLLEPYSVRIEVDRSTGEVVKYHYRVSGGEKIYQPEEIIHIRIPDPLDPIHGRSLLRTIEYVIQQYVYMKLWHINLMKNEARPSGAFVVQGMLTDEQYQKLKEQIDQQLTGASGAGRPLILEGGMDWKELSVSPKELDWIMTQKMLVREIAVALGIAPELLGDSENKTYSNFQEARRQFYYNTVLPLAELIVYEMNRVLGENGFKGFEIAYEDIDALAEDQTIIFDRALRGVQAGVLTINEARKELNLPPIKGGDQIFMNASLMPMLAGFEEMENEEV